jgi:hypothetical protein
MDWYSAVTLNSSVHLETLLAIQIDVILFTTTFVFISQITIFAFMPLVVCPNAIAFIFHPINLVVTGQFLHLDTKLKLYGQYLA